MPFDLYCPSVAGQIHKRMCSCGKYFPSQAAVKGHKVVHHSCPVVEQDEAEESAEQSSIQTDSATDNSTTDVVIVRNLFEWLQSEFAADWIHSFNGGLLLSFGAATVQFSLATAMKQYYIFSVNWILFCSIVCRLFVSI